ncbi:hypothetical protein Tco_0739501 [Tanacetum coccineum]
MFIISLSLYPFTERYAQPYSFHVSYGRLMFWTHVSSFKLPLRLCMLNFIMGADVEDPPPVTIHYLGLEAVNKQSPYVRGELAFISLEGELLAWWKSYKSVQRKDHDMERAGTCRRNRRRDFDIGMLRSQTLRSFETGMIYDRAGDTDQTEKAEATNLGNSFDDERCIYSLYVSKFHVSRSIIESVDTPESVVVAVRPDRIQVRVVALTQYFVLFDMGATHSVISTKFASCLTMTPVPLDHEQSHSPRLPYICMAPIELSDRVEMISCQSCWERGFIRHDVYRHGVHRRSYAREDYMRKCFLNVRILLSRRWVFWVTIVSSEGLPWIRSEDGVFRRLALFDLELMRKGEKFVWNDEREKSFEELKQRLVSAPILTLPSGSVSSGEKANVVAERVKCRNRGMIAGSKNVSAGLVLRVETELNFSQIKEIKRLMEDPACTRAIDASGGVVLTRAVSRHSLFKVFRSVASSDYRHQRAWGVTTKRQIKQISCLENGRFYRTLGVNPGSSSGRAFHPGEQGTDSQNVRFRQLVGMLVHVVLLERCMEIGTDLLFEMPCSQSVGIGGERVFRGPRDDVMVTATEKVAAPGKA